jgi:glycosyltransferase involved in cell wall biosynthesis
MRILFVANINSPLARNWISFFAQGNQVEVICLYPVIAGGLPGVQTHEVPLFLSQAYTLSVAGLSLRRQAGQNINPARQATSRILRRLNVRFGLEQLWLGYVGPVDSIRLRARVQRCVDAFRPDIVHGLRIPMEGESLARLRGSPVVLSIWGNDLTLFASRYLGHRCLTRLALQRADGLHADCERDIRLARQMGYLADKMTLVVPSGGGIRTDQPIDGALVEGLRHRLKIPSRALVVINPRGIRSYVKTREYIAAIPQVMQFYPSTVFISVAVHGDPMVTDLVQRLGLENSVRLLPPVSQTELAALFQLSDVMVSPSIHDGTPNTLLEGMANGAFPVAGDIESVREWVVHGENGLLFAPEDPGEIARPIIRALGDADLRKCAKARNYQLIAERADFTTCMARARDFYSQVIDSWHK